MMFIADPGHGMSNRERGKYDPGAVSGGVAEADIALAWANELRSIVLKRGHKVVRTRTSRTDPAPVSRRDDIAVSYGGDIMLSLHCNSGGGKASGTEVFYRGADDKALASRLSAVVAECLGIRDRGPKLESQSQHKSLAVLEFDKCWLLEIGFIDHPGDRAKMLDPELRRKTCEKIADVMLANRA